MMRSWLARRERTPKGRIFTDTARFYAVLSLHSIIDDSDVFACLMRIIFPITIDYGDTLL